MRTAPSQDNGLEDPNRFPRKTSGQKTSLASSTLGKRRRREVRPASITWMRPTRPPALDGLCTSRHQQVKWVEACALFSTRPKAAGGQPSGPPERSSQRPRSINAGVHRPSCGHREYRPRFEIPIPLFASPSITTHPRPACRRPISLLSSHVALVRVAAAAAATPQAHSRASGLRPCALDY